MVVMIKKDQEEMKATVAASKEMMEAAINSMRSELEDVIKKTGRRISVVFHKEHSWGY
jgi:hypothetical protein